MSGAAARPGAGRVVVLTFAALAVGVAVLVGALLAARAFMPVANYSIVSTAMEPTLRRGQMIWVDSPRAICTHPLLARGDIVLVRWPGHPAPFVDRLIGLPGDLVATRGGLAVVDGRPLTDGSTTPGEATTSDGEVVPQPLHAESIAGHAWRVAVEGVDAIRDTPPRRLGVGEAFVLGDDRGDALDSRSLGPVSTSRICGRVVLVTGTAVS